jgi:periplasmic protein TonB
LTAAQDNEAQDKRWLPVAAAVLLVHAAALYALQAGMLRLPEPEVELPRVISATVLMADAEQTEPAPPAPPIEKQKPKPQKPDVQPVPSKPVVRQPKQEATPKEVAMAPSLTPSAIQEHVPAASNTSAKSTSDAVASAGDSSDKPVQASPPAPVVELPSKAAYLNNPKPIYPAISRRLGEEGTVTLKVLIGADGSAKEVRLSRSSGFERLNDAALDAVKRWRFVPGKRNGVPEAMWFDVPVSFMLD